MKINNILQGDCLELMKDIPNGSINLILTDPPYNIAKKNNFHTMGRAGIDFGEWDKGFDLFSYIDEIPRILSKNGSVIIFNDWKNVGEIARYCESVGLEIKDMIRWVKSNPMPRNRDRRYITDYETAIWCVNKNSKWVFNRQNESYQRPEFKGSLTPQSEKTEHTTQKPLWLMKDLLKIHSNEDDLVLDMFAGSGTTAIACIEMKRQFIVMEKDEKYFEIMKHRINNKLKQTDVQ
jgi:site-specific DNA-methyltransferase (adenine-specific)/modification methylase